MTTTDGLAPKNGANSLTSLFAEGAHWAAAMYAGNRRGELMALRWEDTDLAGGVIRVERSWDENEGAVEPKSNAGFRTPSSANSDNESNAKTLLIGGAFLGRSNGTGNGGAPRWRGERSAPATGI